MKDRKKRPFFKHYKKIFVNEFKGYNGSRLVKDILAGLTVGAVALPLALAFSIPLFTRARIIANSNCENTPAI